LAGGKTFANLTPEEWAAVHPVFAEERPPLTAEASVAARDVPGGTAPGRVAEAHAAAAERLQTASAWLRARERERADVMRRPASGGVNGT